MDEITSPRDPRPTPADDARRRAELDRIRVHRQDDLQRFWELLMWPLGFTRRSLWVTFTDRTGRPTRQLVEIDDLPDGESPLDVRGLFGVLVDALGQGVDELDVALLLVRPGRAGLCDEDRRLAAALLAGARAAGLRCHPVHVADDARVLPVTPDDLAA